MQSIGGLINDLIILGVLIYLILLIHGKVKLGPEKQEKFDEIMNSRGRLLSFFVYGAALIFFVLILMELIKRSP